MLRVSAPDAEHTKLTLVDVDVALLVVEGARGLTDTVMRCAVSLAGSREHPMCAAGVGVGRKNGADGVGVGAASG